MHVAGILALALLAPEDPAWLADADAAFRLARQHDRPIFAVLH